MIDSNVPLPRRGGGFYKYEWEAMEVGDSFFVSDKSLGSISSVSVRAGQRLGMKFTCRTVTERGYVGVRVWRKA